MAEILHSVQDDAGTECQHPEGATPRRHEEKRGRQSVRLGCVGRLAGSTWTPPGSVTPRSSQWNSPYSGNAPAVARGAIGVRVHWAQREASELHADRRLT